MKKSIAVIVCALMLTTVFALSACSGGETKLSYYDQLTEGQDYNRSLFYRNDLVVKAADPSVIYINEGEEKGYFYMYATSDEIGASGYQSWRSKDLVNWECKGVAYTPDRNGWGIQNFWAPECIYYKAEGETTGKYYLFYNAWNDYHPNKYHAIGLAVSETPYGPFVQYTGKNTDGRNLTIRDPFIDAELFPEGSEVKGKPFIDVSPFVDSDGTIYLYFTLDIQGGAASSSIWGMQMKDMYTPIYSSVKQLTRFGFTKVEGGEGITEDDRRRTNEAPFMYKKGDKYYLTYSTSQYFVADYSVGQAVATTPLGDFEKVKAADGGHFLTYNGAPGSDEFNYDHMSGTGHHSFVPVGDELFVVYHAFIDRWYGTNGQGRSIAADRVSFINNGTQDILYVNGPSYSLQPLPAAVSGYKNMAPQAEITATNVKDVGSEAYLKDGIYKNHDFSYIKEFRANGTTTITLTFPKAFNARAVMVYNAFNVAESFNTVKSIKLYKDKSFGSIYDLGFDPLYKYVNPNDKDDQIMRAGGSAIAEFNDFLTDKVVIEIEKDGTLAISDIVILGKEA